MVAGIRLECRAFGPVAVEIAAFLGAPGGAHRIEWRLAGDAQHRLRHRCVSAAALQQRLADRAHDMRAIA